MSKRPLLYIMSPSYSSSTLLSILLGEHPQIATIGELKASSFGDIESYLCSCGEKLLQCPFWQSIVDRMQARGNPFSLRDWGTHFTATPGLTQKLLKSTHRGPAFETARRIAFNCFFAAQSQKNAILQKNADIIETVCELTNKAIFLDGSKDPIRAKFMRDSRRWDLKIIVLIRDGRGITNSHKKHVNTDIYAAIAEWRHKINEIQHFVNTLKREEYITVKYEDFCRDPQATLGQILAFMGLEPFTPSAYQQGTKDRHILGNDMRLKVINEIKLDEKWRKELSPEELRQFSQTAGKLNQTLGYR